ncbi:50S ribosomal protein L25/general stress protein Ctc [Hyphomicrobium sp.]|uniref:50S ribosomal protein L25/general stress protein Ctc n=1 Tax=Hyphomicrobium sp. TaxID=82 RepID=UPI002E302EDF|nr:50S ribosomal protein L25/general stress protein Ctc [Hyphomicrobium sp.]HEX2843386.1 50S ribosomal protein L25/general stress protein Ctc [Hyphomicrobium sp.]
MSEIIEIKATARPRAGKGAARQARREGNVPAVIYGDGQPAEIIAINGNDLWKQFIKGQFTSTVFDINVGNDKTIRVIPRDIQLDPVKDHPIHVDFLRIAKDGVIRVAVPVRFVNHAASPGLKRGGVLNIVRHDVEIYCPYDRIPSAFEINLEGLEIGRSIHISAVTMPDGVRPVIANRDFTVATIAGAKKDDEAATAAAGAEGAAAPAGDAKAAAPAAKGGAAPAKGAAPAAGAKAAPAAKPAAKK